MLITLRHHFTETTRVIFQRLGYHLEAGYRGEMAYARRVGRLPFPRFHLYVHTATSNRLTFRLHLDQKRPSYRGSHAHAAEYSGSVLSAEADRIANSLRRGQQLLQ